MPPGSPWEGCLPPKLGITSPVPMSGVHCHSGTHPQRRVSGSYWSLLHAPSCEAWCGQAAPGAKVRKGSENLKNPVSTTRLTTGREKTTSVRPRSEQDDNVPRTFPPEPECTRLAARGSCHRRGAGARRGRASSPRSHSTQAAKLRSASCQSPAVIVRAVASCGRWCPQ